MPKQYRYTITGAELESLWAKFEALSQAKLVDTAENATLLTFENVFRSLKETFFEASSREALPVTTTPLQKDLGRSVTVNDTGISGADLMTQDEFLKRVAKALKLDPQKAKETADRMNKAYWQKLLFFPWNLLASNFKDFVRVDESKSEKDINKYQIFSYEISPFKEDFENSNINVNKRNFYTDEFGDLYLKVQSSNAKITFAGNKHPDGFLYGESETVYKLDGEKFKLVHFKTNNKVVRDFMLGMQITPTKEGHFELPHNKYSFVPYHPLTAAYDQVFNHDMGNYHDRYQLFKWPLILGSKILKYFGVDLPYNPDSYRVERLNAFLGFPRKGNGYNWFEYIFLGFILTPVKNLLKLISQYPLRLADNYLQKAALDYYREIPLEVTDPRKHEGAWRSIWAFLGFPLLFIPEKEVNESPSVRAEMEADLRREYRKQWLKHILSLNVVIVPIENLIKFLVLYPLQTIYDGLIKQFPSLAFKPGGYLSNKRIYLEKFIEKPIRTTLVYLVTTTVRALRIWTSSIFSPIATAKMAYQVHPLLIVPSILLSLGSYFFLAVLTGPFFLKMGITPIAKWISNLPGIVNLKAGIAHVFSQASAASSADVSILAVLYVSIKVAVKYTIAWVKRNLLNESEADKRQMKENNLAPVFESTHTYLLTNKYVATPLPSPASSPKLGPLLGIQNESRHETTETPGSTDHDGKENAQLEKSLALSSGESDDNASKRIVLSGKTSISEGSSDDRGSTPTQSAVLSDLTLDSEDEGPDVSTQGSVKESLISGVDKINDKDSGLTSTSSSEHSSLLPSLSKSPSGKIISIFSQTETTKKLLVTDSDDDSDVEENFREKRSQRSIM